MPSIPESHKRLAIFDNLSLEAGSWPTCLVSSIRSTYQPIGESTVSVKDKDLAPYPLLIYLQFPAPYSLYPFSIQLCLQPTTESGSHISHIFSFLDGHGSETLFIGQWKSHLLLGKGIHGRKTYREIGIRDVLKKGDKRFVTITSDSDGTNI